MRVVALQIIHDMLLAERIARASELIRLVSGSGVGEDLKGIVSQRSVPYGVANVAGIVAMWI